MKITKEEELLLEQYGRTPSNKSNKLIYVNALLVSLTPIWLYWRIHEMELIPHLILFSIFTGLATYLISCAYTNSKAPLMERIAIIRTDAITQEILKQLGNDKKSSKKDRDDMIRQKTKDVADYESTTFSIFYINAIFILIVMITSTILHQLSDPVNYAFSMLIASGLTAFLSSAKQTKQHRP
uniref:Translocon-associated protein subunit gamma n=1 Tax=Mesocestoides corti TaxID=53468 RepID=A0A5K3ELF1_MESCO